MPFYHSNIDNDELLFYHDGDFFSRKGIDKGMATLHPAGVHHGPQPGAAEGAATKVMTDEVAVMIECLEPLTVSPEAEKASIDAYATSWARASACSTSDPLRGAGLWRGRAGPGGRGAGPARPVVVRRAGGGGGPEPGAVGAGGAGLAAALLSATFAVAFFACVLVHELAHALVARTIGVPTTEIRLFVFGGVARIAGEPADAGGEALVAMAGPLASVILAGLFALASWGRRARRRPAGLAVRGQPGGGRLQPAARVPAGRRAGGQGAGLAGHRAAPARHQGHRRLGRTLAAVLVVGGAGAAIWQQTPRWLPQVVLGLFLWRAAADGERAATRRNCSPGGPSAGSLMSMVVTARLRPPDRIVEVADVRRVADLLARLEVLPGAVLVIRDGALLTSQDELRDGDKVEVRFAISGV